MKTLQRTKRYTERALQFGEGNFLRCFIDWQIDILNEKKNLDIGVTVVRPIGGSSLPLLDSQDGLYTTIVRGLDEQGKPAAQTRVIESVNREIPVNERFDDYLAVARNPQLRYIFSNTTEAGIVFERGDLYSDCPPKTFPAKLARFLHERFKACPQNGLAIIPCELIEDNGAALKKAVLQYAELWNLEEEFKTWLDKGHIWCDTLVDRIVTGFPADEKEQLWQQLGYQDNFMAASEHFHFFAIKGPASLAQELQLEGSGLNVVVAEDIVPYKKRKVAILNGAHTLLVPVAYLAGQEYVRESMEDEDLNRYVRYAVFSYIIPTLPLPQAELESYAEAVINRFKNPYIKHKLTDIALNSVSKYKARVLPQVLNYQEKFGRWPKPLVFGLAALIRFYKGEREDGSPIALRDDAQALEMCRAAWQAFNGDYLALCQKILGDGRLWGEDLAQKEGLAPLAAQYLQDINENGARAALKRLLA